MNDSAESELVGEARERRGRRPSRREAGTSLLTSGSFLAGASLFALLAHSTRPLSWPTAAVLVVAFALLARCEFEIGSGSAVPTQLAFVPMLFVLPLPLVPLLVCAGYLLSALIDAFLGRARLDRSFALAGCSWFSLAPALLLFAAGERAPSWNDWPLYVAAFGAQCGADFLHSALQQWLACGVSPRVLARPLLRVYAFDALLSPVTFLAARDGSLSFLALTPLLAIFAALIHERRCRFDALLEAARAEALALTDPLTGLPNRRAFQERLAAETTRGPLTVCLLDVDHFKAYNDTYGHPAGDELLRDLGTAWRDLVRPGDLLARFGGEEFALLLPRCTLSEARPIVERLRHATPHGQTCSAGAACGNPAEGAESLIQRADEALYRAKRAGRARLEVADDVGRPPVLLRPPVLEALPAAVGG
jgi:diguanylate cyclase (GGDEF)-like protein